ncbi:hypothetical protein BSZ39_11200 [Bowdeniella nasicola]|uniref:ABC-2 type transporter transmembrane domain-containing protein n=1 Tax=Bowdeniella nasicola TaxID=208480 RepID=A0A1Q5PZS1_9ACTO|nr:YhgE/Pip domain-containing protein [Bowdeniella nasicola]OKL53123.1 hypothetical protein BSZ39_11200 [Bowdeniella nasicola]
MNIIQIALVEIRRMTTGILPKLAIVALSIVPVLYGAVYLYANWDPYSRLDHVQAALVNLDEGATIDEGDTHKEMEVGADVTKQLIDDHTFGWQTVSSQEEADEGVRSGRFSFALTIPKDFSANLASPTDFSAAEQAILTVTTNDANNYLLSTIVDKLAGTVHNTVASKVGKETADAMLTGFGRIHTQLVRAADGASQLHDGTSKLRNGVGDLSTGATTLSNGIDEANNGAHQLADGSKRLSTGLSQLHDATSALPGSAKQLNDGAQRLASGARDLNDGADTLAEGAAQVAAGNKTLDTKLTEAINVVDGVVSDAEKRFDETVQKLVDDGIITPEQVEQLKKDFRNSAAGSEAIKRANEVKKTVHQTQSQVHKLADGAQQVADGAKRLRDGSSQLSSGAGELANGTSKLNDSVPTLVSAITQADDGAGQLNAGATKLASGTTELSDGGHQLVSGIGSLSDGAKQLDEGTSELATQLGAGADEIPNPDDAERDRVSTVIGDPISIAQLEQTHASSYGAGLAPFFLVLAIWIGAFILVQIMQPMSTRALSSNGEAWKISLGSWLPFLMLSLIQTVLLYLVVHFGLGLKSAYPWLTLGLLFLASATFTALIHGVVALFEVPGKFVVLILLVLQLVSSGGTFPWETLPETLQTLHQWLPMGYVVTGMRHLIYGSDLSAVSHVPWYLLGFLLLGLLLGYLGAVRNRYWRMKTLQPEMVE